MTDQLFFEQVGSWVRAALAAGESDFNRLVAGLPSVDPAIVLDILRTLEASDGSAVAALSSAKMNFPSATPVESLIDEVIPHPLDYDWRFSDESRVAIVDLIESLGNVGTIALLGAPSLGCELKRRCPEWTVHVLDKNALWSPVLSKCGAIYWDVNFESDSAPCELTSTCDAVVCDPPWYLAAEMAFMEAARSVIVHGGPVFRSRPPYGVRASIESERSQLSLRTELLGFSEPHLETVIRYKTPPFERAALRASGIALTDTNWRQGELVSQVAIHAPSFMPHIIGQAVAHWSEVQIDGVRIKFRNTESESTQSPALINIVPGDVLPSVSSRHSVRPLVDVWSMGNRVYSCANPTLLLEIARALAAERLDRIDAIKYSQLTLDQENISIAVEQLKILVQLERDEMKDAS